MLRAATTTTPSVPRIPVGPMLGELWHIAIGFWPIWAIFLVAAGIKFAWEIRGIRRLARSGIDEIDRMSGLEFERLLGELFRQRGYTVRLTPSGADQGADLVIKRDGRTIAVQAKRWRKRVGNKAVQEVVAAKAMYGCGEALVVTNNYFTEAAQKLALANAVALWDRDELVKRLLEARPDTGGATSLGTA